MKSISQVIQLAVLTVLALPLSGIAKPAAQTKSQKTILLAIDGLSYNALTVARQNGLFKQFKNPSKHVAPFPSMTDLSWSEVFNTAEVFGSQGRIGSVEATYFDESSQGIKGDPRDYYRRLAAPKYYMGAFDHFFNPYVEGLMYFPTEEVPRKEISSVIDSIIADSEKDFIAAYIGAVDSIAHTQPNRLYPVLKELDFHITRLFTEFKNKGHVPELILVSDHGNIGAFKEGEIEKELNAVDIESLVNKSGFNFVQQLSGYQDVAMPLMALGTWAPVYFKDASLKRSFIDSFKNTPWFDQGISIISNSTSHVKVLISSKNGDAELTYDKIFRNYDYKQLTGNPLNLKSAGKMNAEQAAQASVATSYPDAVVRIIDAVSSKNFDFPDLIITLHDGYYLKGPLGKFTKMYRTHGSLSKNSSMGIIASSTRQFNSEIRSKDVLPTIGKTYSDFFKQELREIQFTQKELANQITKNKNEVQTDAKNFSSNRIFQFITRFLADSRPYFVPTELNSIFKIFQNFDGQSLPTAQNASFAAFNPMEKLTPEDIGQLTDAVMQSKSPEDLKTDRRIIQVKDRLFGNQSSKSEGDWINQLHDYVMAGKRSTMKVYQIPVLLSKALVVQEKSVLPDTRDTGFAKYWSSNKEKINRSQAYLNGDKSEEKSSAKRLFAEVFKENLLAEKIFPTKLDRIYQTQTKELPTIVYVPGIYNDLFDQEIFSLGLSALKEELGFRLLKAPLISTCSSEVNGEALLKMLKNDQKNQISKNGTSPKYLILGYSKGGVDALSAFAKDPEFTARNVSGLVTIASPLKGSSILDKSDLPMQLVQLLSENSNVTQCQGDKSASSSISPLAMARFWKRNERKLIGITRYFSVSFESTPEDSHLFMQATKLIAQFEEDNDGVVTLSSSKFPESLGSVDLGTVHGDHLSGILSSSFPQKAFMKAIAATTSELGAFHSAANFYFNIETMRLAAKSLNPGSPLEITALSQNTVNVKTYNSRTGAFFGNEISEKSFSSLSGINQYVFPPSKSIADTYEVKVMLPENTLKYDSEFVLDVAKLPDLLQNSRVKPIIPNTTKEIDISFDHKSMIEFRLDYQFNYESLTPPNMDDNQESGYLPTEIDGESWVQMKSVNNSIRLTTSSIRFKPMDFPNIDLKVLVKKGVRGADPVKGRTGKDDSAFQVWFTVRETTLQDRSLVDQNSDKVFLFGYHWGDPAKGENRKAGDLFENWYSNKNFVVATLPESFQIQINNGDSDLGKILNVKRRLTDDLRRAFPKRDLSKMEIIAITIQHDSNDTKDSSEAYFKHLKFNP